VSPVWRRYLKRRPMSVTVHILFHIPRISCRSNIFASRKKELFFAFGGLYGLLLDASS